MDDPELLSKIMWAVASMRDHQRAMVPGTPRAWRERTAELEVKVDELVSTYFYDPPTVELNPLPTVPT